MWIFLYAALFHLVSHHFLIYSQWMCFLSQVIVCIIVYQCVLEMQNRATENHIKFLPGAVLHPLPTKEFHIVDKDLPGQWSSIAQIWTLLKTKNKFLATLTITNLGKKVISLKNSITCIFYVNFLLLCSSLCSGTAENLKWLFEMHLKLFFMPAPCLRIRF